MGRSRVYLPHALTREYPGVARVSGTGLVARFSVWSLCRLSDDLLADSAVSFKQPATQPMSLILLRLAAAASDSPDTPVSDNVLRTRPSSCLADTYDVNSFLASKIVPRKAVWPSLGVNPAGRLPNPTVPLSLTRIRDQCRVCTFHRMNDIHLGSPIS